MTIETCGPLGLDGTCTHGSSNRNQIGSEVGDSPGTRTSLNDSNLRSLAGKPSGTISFHDFYGKSSRATRTYTFTSNSYCVGLNVATGSYTGTVGGITISGSYSSGKTCVTINVNSGVYLYSNCTSIPGLSLTGGTTGDVVKLVNYGYIMGKGGGGGGWGTNHASPCNYCCCGTMIYGFKKSCYSATGRTGGPAIKMNFNLSICNQGYIGGGGGGGGASGSLSCYATGAAGGGGAGGGDGGKISIGCNVLAGGNGGAPGSAGTSAGYLTPCGSPVHCSEATNGGGGGRIMPGSGGAGGRSWNGGRVPCGCNIHNWGYGGGAGGGGGVCNQAFFTCVQNQYGGAGGGAGCAGATVSTTDQNGGGGGGWGAYGGSGYASRGCYGGAYAGGAGGKAICKNGYTLTVLTNGTIYGAVS